MVRLLSCLKISVLKISGHGDHHQTGNYRRNFPEHVSYQKWISARGQSENIFNYMILNGNKV